MSNSRLTRRFWLLSGLTLAAALLLPATTGPLTPGPSPARGEGSNAASLQTLVEADWIDADRLFTQRQGGAKPAAAAPVEVTTEQDAAGGCDGIKTGLWGFHTASGERDPWWHVDLGKVFPLDRIVVFNRTDGKSAARTRKLQILVSQESTEQARPDAWKLVYEHDGSTFLGVKENQPLVVNLAGRNIQARSVRVQVLGTCSFALDEIEVYAADAPQKNIALKRPADQKSVGRYSTRQKSPEGPWAVLNAASAKAASAATAPAFSLKHSRQVVEQGQALAARIRTADNAAVLEGLVAELKKLTARADALDRQQGGTVDARQTLYFAARRIARQITWANPRLPRDPLLFVKRHDAGGVYHMCDQFYGFNAKPGGGLYLLRDPFGPAPQLVDVLANSTVQRGRLKGQKLEGGSFLSPELSFDGRTILFAYTEALGKNLEWSPTASYHLFRVNVDGSGLEQLTDGPWNDFDPCFLPGGRVAFISERRGGYLRCGRHCPTYTLFSMEPDGSDIICLSYHETHEWQPSVAHDGMLVYTRWDYVDRDTNIAHHIWSSFPDGRDPRSFHGNYPLKREARPWMEMDIRAVPGSHKFVATAAAHHGHAFGSLVLIDPRVPDDNVMAQLERLTPEVAFPEAEGGKGAIAGLMVYGTPWPLSEDDYLCAYDSAAKNHGLYWIDRFGNRELIYRDPAIASLSPFPVAARPRPPVIPDRTTQAADARDGKKPAEAGATVAVMNVYESDFAWPADTKIAALRVVQVLAKATAPPNEPRIGVANQTNARAVLGTVPVEADGSAFFQTPPGKAIYFQALDEQGLAVQSMRSATYLHAGEQLTCIGCHEAKHRPSPPPAQTPLALRRGPSPITPDVAGSNPFSYVRLVQPVLDRHCVACHQEKKAVDLTGVVEGKNEWTRSYTNLAKKYGFYYDVGNGSINTAGHGGARSRPGQMGARVAKLLDYLDDRHYGVRLAPEELHRITLWLDCNSEFFGSYENTAAQARGEVVWPTLE